MIGALALQGGYALGFLSMLLAGSKHRIRECLGWGMAVSSEAAFALWAWKDHVPGAYPWIVCWSAVYVLNWLKWRGSAVHQA